MYIILVEQFQTKFTHSFSVDKSLQVFLHGHKDIVAVVPIS